MSFRTQLMRYMNPYDIHKVIINDYVLRKSGDTKLLKRDASKDKTDLDVIKENHKFLWEDETPDTWEAQFAKKYYDKLFKEYCISDLSRYKENKVAMRWRTEQEVISGKGQFICANKICKSTNDLRTWEVNFSYLEEGSKKNALVKIRLCPECSRKLNYHTKKKEIRRLKVRSKKNKKFSHKLSKEIKSDDVNEAGNSNMNDLDDDKSDIKNDSKTDSPWENIKPIETKTRDEEMEEYLQDLLL